METQPGTRRTEPTGDATVKTRHYGNRINWYRYQHSVEDSVPRYGIGKLVGKRTLLAFWFPFGFLTVKVSNRAHGKSVIRTPKKTIR